MPHKVPQYCEVFVHRLRRPYTSGPQYMCIGAGNVHRRPPHHAGLIHRAQRHAGNIHQTRLFASCFMYMCVYHMMLDILCVCVYYGHVDELSSRQAPAPTSLSHLLPKQSFPQRLWKNLWKTGGYIIGI